MDDPGDTPSQPPENQNSLPDVVHSQQIPASETGISEPPSINLEREAGRSLSESGSISEHIVSNAEYSLSDVEAPKPLSVERDDSANSSGLPHSSINQTSSAHIDPRIGDLRDESPVPPPLSSDASKDAVTLEQSQSGDASPHESQEDNSEQQTSKYSDSLNNKSDKSSQSERSERSLHSEKSEDASEQDSLTGSDVIKLDIRGQGVPKIPLTTSEIIFGLPPEGAIIEPELPNPMYATLLSPIEQLIGQHSASSQGSDHQFGHTNLMFQLTSNLSKVLTEEALTTEGGDLVFDPEQIKEIPSDSRLLSSILAQDSMTIDEIVDESEIKDDTNDETKDMIDPPIVEDIDELDKEQLNIKLPKEKALESQLLSPTLVKKSISIEEIDSPNSSLSKIEQSDLLIEEMLVEDTKVELEEDQVLFTPKSLAREEQSFSTLTTEYKTIEEYNSKLLLLEERINERNQVIQELSVSLQQVKNERDRLINENKHLHHDMYNLQVEEKGQLSDLVKYETMKDDSTRFYSAFMSSGSSLSSKGDQKDNDNEEITVNYSRSDIRSDASDELEPKLNDLLTQLALEENVKNKLMEELTLLVVDAVHKARIEADSEGKQLVKELQSECHKLRELLVDVKSDNPDVEALRNELHKNHEKDMADLRTYFEKKCTDMSRSFSFSEEVLRSSAPDGAGDFRRTKSVELTSADESQEMNKLRQKYEQQMEEMERLHGEQLSQMETIILDLKEKLQPVGAEMYQDIDMELEKEQLDRVEMKQLLRDMQVLLSDPNAETSNWPTELIALREIYTDVANRQTPHEYSSLREEILSDTDKRKQRRNLSYDQNRHLEEVTKERDGLKVIAENLQLAVIQLMSYCSAVDDELNNTVISELLANVKDSTLVSSRHVHFAPQLSALSEGELKLLATSRDSLDLKRDLEHSLLRLRKEAQKILTISNTIDNRLPAEKTSDNEMKIKEVRYEMQCDNCETHKKNLSESLHNESVLRAELESTKKLIAELMRQDDHLDVIAEGYGTVSPRPHSLPSRSLPLSPLTHSISPREREIDSLVKERDDLAQQLEAANRQLKSTRQFVEEQTADREQERDEFTRRIHQLRDENTRLTNTLHNNARILGEVEQLELQAKEMNKIISDLETKKTQSDKELKTYIEEIQLQRETIANLEQQLEQKIAKHDKEIMIQLEEMRATIDERDSKMRTLLGELETLRSERVDNSDVSCIRCAERDEEEQDGDEMELVKGQILQIESWIHNRCVNLEHVHEECSASCSEHTEDVSYKDQKSLCVSSPLEQLSEAKCRPLIRGIWQQLVTLSRAEDAAVKRIRDLEMQRAQLKNIAQEVRCERDVLQSRMSEQALRLSSLSARLESQRHCAAADTEHATAAITVRLHDAQAQIQRLTEELDVKEKQLARLKQNIQERDDFNEEKDALYGNSCNPKDKVIILERSLDAAQKRITQLEETCAELQTAETMLKEQLKEKDTLLEERKMQLQEILALKLDEDKTEQKSEANEAKHSARTLSDIVSISDYDEEDLQMRRVDPQSRLNQSIHSCNNNKTLWNTTLPPDNTEKHQVTSLPEPSPDNVKHSPRADSLPVNLSKQFLRNYKRNINETTVFGSFDKFGENVQHSTAQKVPDNSMYPNRDVSVDRNTTVEPRRINFSLESSQDNRTRDEGFTRLKELGVILEVNPDNLPEILSQLKRELIQSKSELENCKSEMKQAEEQLCEFPALKEEVEELKTLLENTMATMENDKKFYENQLESFKSNKIMLEEKLTELTEENKEKFKDLHLLKEDLLRRENMILELAKEKRNLTNKYAELEIKADDLQRRNDVLTKYENDNKQLKEKVNEMNKLQQLVSEKNQQIDSLNQHLDQVDDLQRRLNDKTDQLDNLKETLVEKSNDLFQLQDTIEALKSDISNSNEENSKLIITNKDLKLKLSKIEKEHENSSLRLQSNELEVDRLSSINKELSNKIEELKEVTYKLKDKECEIEMLNEDIHSFHEEIATLKEQLKMVSRSPSPRKTEEQCARGQRANDDRRQLVKIRKQISILQHELDFQKKELNDQAFELAKSKLDVTELTNTVSLNSKQLFDKDLLITSLTQERDNLRQQLQELEGERDSLRQQLELVTCNVREEGGINELKYKLKQKTEECRRMEIEVETLRNNLETVPDNMPVAVSGTRSPTAELEHALRTQLDYSHQLDDDIIEQILSSSSDAEEIPPLALNISKSSSSVYSSSSERISRLRCERDNLQLQVTSLEERIHDKEALITELKAVRETMRNECDKLREQHAAERDNCTRLQLLLDTHKHTAETLQSQDANMISILNKRLESAMKTELNMQQRLATTRTYTDTQEQIALEQARAEITSLQRKLELERTTQSELLSASQLQYNKLHMQLNATNDLLNSAKRDLAATIREKQDYTCELSRCRQLIEAQSDTIRQLEAKLMSPRKENLTQALNEFENHKCELTREIATLKRCLELYQSGQAHPASPVATLLDDNKQLQERLRSLEDHNTHSTEKDNAMRYLHSRCLKLESCRKALVWQKRYLQRALYGYRELEVKLGLSQRTPRSTGKKLFKSVALCIVVTCRMRFLVRRRATAKLVANIITAQHHQPTTPTTSSRASNKCDTVYRQVARSRLMMFQSPSTSSRRPNRPATNDDSYLIGSLQSPRRVTENNTFLNI